MKKACCLLIKSGLIFFIFLVMIQLSTVYAARNGVSLTVEGASNTISGDDDDLSLDSSLNFYIEDDLFNLTVENTSRDDGHLYVSFNYVTYEEDIEAPYWFVLDNSGDFPMITLEDNKESIGKLKSRSDIVLLNFALPEDFTFDKPVVFTAYLFADDDGSEGDLIGMDSKTVFFRPFEGASLSEIDNSDIF